MGKKHISTPKWENYWLRYGNKRLWKWKKTSGKENIVYNKNIANLKGMFIAEKMTIINIFGSDLVWQINQWLLKVKNSSCVFREFLTLYKNSNWDVNKGQSTTAAN